MQEQLIRFFADISVPWLDRIAILVTMLGEQYFAILVVSFLYWNISRKEGFKLAAAFMYSGLLNSAVKIAVHSRRPFEKLAFLSGKRLETATGYSFPSGHTQGATTFFITLAQIVRKRWFTVMALILAVLVGLSRVYLGVHWPVDVIGGWILGILLAYIFCSIVDNSWDNHAKLRRFFFRLQAVVLIATLVLLLVDLFWLRGSMKISDFFKIAGTSSGAVYGFFIEQKYFDFSPEDAGRIKKAARYIIGVAAAIGIMTGLKMLLPEHHIADFFRYLITGLWLTLIWPAAGIGLRLFNRSSRVQ